MNSESNQGAKCCFNVTTNGVIHRWKHSNWSNVDSYGNFGRKDLSQLLPSSYSISTPTSSVPILPIFAEPIQNQSSTFCTSVSPSSTLDPRMKFLYPGSSATEYTMPQTQTMLRQGENLAPSQQYEDQQIMNGGHSELLGDIIAAGTTGRTNILSQQKGLQIQSKQFGNHNAQIDGSFTATTGHSIANVNQNQTNKSISFSISSSDAFDKPRMRWTRNLHDCFVQAINALGCGDKATPKSIHKKMGVKGLTIYHVKSYLQKYRLTRYLPDSKEDKRSFHSELTNRTTTPERESDQPSKKSAPNSEALCLQREIQKSLGILIEFQSELELRAEENARQLQKLFEKHNKVGEIMLASQSISSTNSAVIAGPSSTRIGLAQDQFNDKRNVASLRNNLHEGDEDMLELEVRFSPDSQKKSKG